MSDLLDKAHVDAALNLLRADSGLTVYPDTNGDVPTTITPPYVRVYSSIERPSEADGNAMDGLSSAWTVRWYCHCVGSNDYAAVAVAMRVRAALLDVRPTIVGRACGLFRQEAAQPPQRDESTGPVVIDAVVVYRLNTQPG